MMRFFGRFFCRLCGFGIVFLGGVSRWTAGVFGINVFAYLSCHGVNKKVLVGVESPAAFAHIHCAQNLVGDKRNTCNDIVYK